jgi:hypothetical protein
MHWSYMPSPQSDAGYCPSSDLGGDTLTWSSWQIKWVVLF